MKKIKKLVKKLQTIKQKELNSLTDEAFAAKLAEIEKALPPARDDINQRLDKIKNG